MRNSTFYFHSLIEFVYHIRDIIRIINAKSACVAKLYLCLKN